jgi:hypothetical protein
LPLRSTPQRHLNQVQFLQWSVQVWTWTAIRA